ncbi:hypothetical protein DL93DRAFT_2228021 [Clavulina sp. PMI_390]|nr:hypothetical protein DL93DRAFT_2228021 [Clavulina sp. PMI_390]
MSAPDPLFMASHYAGPIQAGAYVNTLFTGVALMQLQVYVRKYRNDTIIIRLLVAVCCILMALNTATTCFQAYNQSIVHFGSVEATYTFSQPFQINLDLLVFTSTFVQLFFAWRVKRLTGRTWVLAIVAIMVLFNWAVTIASACIGHVHATILQAFSITGWSVALAVDILITTNLVLFFNTRKTGFSDTDDFLGRLNRLTVQTGVVISTWNVAIIITLATTSDFTDLAFILASPPLYVITLLSSLNSRHATGHGNHWSDDTPWTNSANLTGPRRTTNHGLSNIQVTRTIEQNEAYALDERSPAPTASEPVSPWSAPTHPYATSRAAAQPTTNSKISHLVNMAPREISQGDIDEESESGKVDLELASDHMRLSLPPSQNNVAVPQYDVYDGTQRNDAKGRAM